MVLISIHPFAFRKIFLVLLALLGFSALCFADPVLMARRYSRDHSRATVALSGQLFRVQFTEGIARTQTVGSDKAEAFELRDSRICFQTQPDQCEVEALGDLPSAPFFWSTTRRD